MVSLTDNKIYTIAGNGSSSSSMNEGYANIIPIIPKSLMVTSYLDNTNNLINELYIVDSSRICSIIKPNIPNKPSGSVYYFNPSTSPYINVGEIGESDYTFDKNIFTIQCLMYMEGNANGNQKLFTFEAGNTIQLGITFDIGSVTIMNLFINNRIYPYDSANNISIPIKFNNSEITNLWVHIGLVNNGSTLSIYKNGIIIYTLDSRSFSFNTTVKSQLIVGKNFKGFIRDFLIYNNSTSIYNNANKSYDIPTLCTPNLVLHLANGSSYFVDSSLPNISLQQNNVRTIDSFPYSDTYKAFQINLNYNDNTRNRFVFNTQTSYSYIVNTTTQTSQRTSFIMNLLGLKNIQSFNLYSLEDTKAIQQWLLEGSTNGIDWIILHEQVEPYRTFSSPIYPKVNSDSAPIPIQIQRNIGGDYVTMTKSFQVATLIADCSIVITSNIDPMTGNYTKGVTSSNGFFIQDNTPYVVDSSGTDVSGFQYIGNLLSDYESNIKSLYDPIISNANTISGKMKSKYQKTLSDTYDALGKLNTLDFYSNKFNNYDNLRSYMLSNVRFTNSIFDNYPDTNSYMSNIISFGISDSKSIDIVFNKVDLIATTNPSAISYGTITTAGARYTLSVTKGFLDLTATFLSNITPNSNILNDDYTANQVVNPRGKDYKDRLNQTSKLVSARRTPLTTVTQSSLPTDLSLTGLTGVTTSNIIDAITNKIEYMITTTDNLPIGKTNYIVQYVSPTEVNSVESATIDTTIFKINISSVDNVILVNKFIERFNLLHTITKGYIYNSIIKKVYGIRKSTNILYLSVGIEYTNIDNTIYYNMVPSISEFGTQKYYRVVFKTNNDVLAFEEIKLSDIPSDVLPLSTDVPSLSTTTTNVNIYKNNLLWKQMKFIPFGDTTTYSISQIEYYHIKDNKPIKIPIQSLSIDGENTDNFDLTKLIDEINISIRNIQSMSGRYFTHTYSGGTIIATFSDSSIVNGFSFMTAYSLQNPQKWIVQGTNDGVTWINLLEQNDPYLSVVESSIYNSFYRTPIFNFSGEANIPILSQPSIRTNDSTTDTLYFRLKITPLSSASSLSYQLTQISLYNGQTMMIPNLSDTTLSYLFNPSNLSQTNPQNVQTYENNISSPLIITFRSRIQFNGISFVTGIDVNKCLTKWKIEASPSANGDVWNEIHTQDFHYTNNLIDYPHYFCKTPIFYNGAIIDMAQPSLYETKSWPIRHVRFKPIIAFGRGTGEIFEVSHFDFFNGFDRIPVISDINANLLTPIITCANPPQSGCVPTRANNLTVFVGNYNDPSTNHIDFFFNSPQSFDGFSFMSGPNINNCVQLWTLEVSTDNNGVPAFWVVAHSANSRTLYVNNRYPSPYYRLPIIFLNKNINISSYVKYYIITGNPTVSTNTGRMFEVNLLYGRADNLTIINFITRDYNNKYKGSLFSSTLNLAQGSTLRYNNFITKQFEENTIYYSTSYSANSYSPPSGSILYKLKNGTSPFEDFIAAFISDDSINSIVGYSVNDSPTIYNIYTNIETQSGLTINRESIRPLDQIPDNIIPNQGFTNYTKIDYIETFLLQTNKTFDIKLFRFITSNNKVLPKMFYDVESNNKNFIIRLKAYVEIIGYTITTGLYSQVSDPDSWKLFGMKNGSYILLDKQDNYDIPVERSTTLPPFYFGSKEKIRSIKDTTKDEKKPNMEIIELYYKQKINPFGKAVFKQYMYDNDKTYYMVFDEYDNNRNLIGEDFIIGFVIVKGKVKKPIMYENPDGSFDAFNLKRKEMMTYWKKKILIHGLKLETKYLSDY
jgi:hypothetical protein